MSSEIAIHVDTCCGGKFNSRSYGSLSWFLMDVPRKDLEVELKRRDECKRVVNKKASVVRKRYAKGERRKP